MSAPELRPMGIGDILDTTFRLYRQKFATFLLIALIVYVPYTVIMSGIHFLIMSPVVAGAASPAQSNFGVPQSPAPGRHQPPMPGANQMNPASVQHQIRPEFNTAAFTSAISSVLIVALVFGVILFPLCSAALTENVSAAYLGKTLSAGESYSLAVPRLLSLIGTSILAGIIILIGVCLCVVPGIIFSVWFYVVTPIVILEKIGGTGALKRSRELIRENFWKTLLLGIAVWLINVVFGWIIGFICGIIPWPHLALQMAVQNILPALWLPIQTAPFILLYYDLRIRKEAFDLQQLSLALTEPAT